MCLQRLVVQVLLAVTEADARDVRLGAGAVETGLPVGLLHAGSERGAEESQLGVRTEGSTVRGHMPGTLAPLLQRDVVEPGVTSRRQRGDGVAEQRLRPSRRRVRIDHGQGGGVVEDDHRRGKHRGAIT